MIDDGSVDKKEQLKRVKKKKTISNFNLYRMERKRKWPFTYNTVNDGSAEEREQ